jgi:peptide/nickel transport system ATP-binding protein/oligopeptide transport system ATP-binding protein
VSAPLLAVEDLRVSFDTRAGPVLGLDGVSYELGEREGLALVGEAAAGKTVACLTTLGLTRSRASTIAGRILFEGQDLVSLSARRLRRIRGREIAMSFQDPLLSLHPLYELGTQLTAVIRAHRELSRSAARDRAIDQLEAVGVPEPHRCVDRRPHELPDGMRRRAAIAVALANEPKLLIADEPTAGLAATAQTEIVELLADLRRRLGFAIIIATRDRAIAGELADRIVVMRAGRIIERAPG